MSPDSFTGVGCARPRVGRYGEPVATKYILVAREVEREREPAGPCRGRVYPAPAERRPDYPSVACVCSGACTHGGQDSCRQWTPTSLLAWSRDAKLSTILSPTPF